MFASIADAGLRRLARVPANPTTLSNACSTTARRAWSCDGQTAGRKPRTPVAAMLYPPAGTRSSRQRPRPQFPGARPTTISPIANEELLVVLQCGIFVPSRTPTIFSCPQSMPSSWGPNDLAASHAQARMAGARCADATRQAMAQYPGHLQEARRARGPACAPRRGQSAHRRTRWQFLAHRSELKNDARPAPPASRNCRHWSTRRHGEILSPRGNPWLPRGLRPRALASSSHRLRPDDDHHDLGTADRHLRSCLIFSSSWAGALRSGSARAAVWPCRAPPTGPS